MPTTTNYIWDDQNYLAESDATNTINVVYTNEPQGFGNLVSSRISGTTSYHHFDALGSTRQLTTSAAAVTDTMIYDAWGNVLNRTGATVAALLWIGELGYYFDVELTSAHIRRRAYRPVAARWTSVDPVWAPTLLYPFVRRATRRYVETDVLANAPPYVYAGNNPADFVDPSGLELSDLRVLLKSKNFHRIPVAVAAGPNAFGAFIDLEGDCCDVPPFTYGQKRENIEGRSTALATAVYQSCQCAVTAAHLIEFFWPEVQEYFGPRGINIPLLYKNRDFYLSRLKEIEDACNSGTMKFGCPGERCQTDRETKAYVEQWRIGWTLWLKRHWGDTIFLCELFWNATAAEQASTILHEFGRLFGHIGDADAPSTDSITSWDAILENLCSASGAIEKLRPKP